MSESTQGQLVAHEPSGGKIGLYAAGHGYVAFVYVGGAPHFSEAQHANARRLLACWNACVGVPTEVLEAIAAGSAEHSMQVYRRLADEAAALGAGPSSTNMAIAAAGATSTVR